MSLIINDNTIPTGAVWDINGVAVNSVECNGIPVWGSTEEPGVVEDFKATDSEYGKVIMTWTNASGLPTPHYSLYKNGVLVKDSILSGYEYVISPGTYTFNVVAYNDLGNTVSNYDDGTSLLRQEFNQVTVNYSSASGDTDYIINNGGGNWTFIPPSGHSEFEVVVVGAGGGGAKGYKDDYTSKNAGGGRAGQQRKFIHLASGAKTLHIGKGGVGATYSGNPTSGGSTSFDTTTSSGGGAGVTQDTAYPAYSGMGKCHTNIDGNGACDGNWTYVGNVIAYGGQSSYGNGGSAGKTNASSPGVRGGGGGGLVNDPAYTFNKAGAGGDGLVIIRAV